MSDSFFKTLETQITQSPKARIVIPMAADKSIAFAITQCLSRNLIKEAKLIGNADVIKSIFKDYINDPRIAIKQADTEEEAVNEALADINSSKSDILMKGKISSSTFLKALNNPQNSLKHDFLSHITCFQLPDKDEFQILTDAFVNNTQDEDTICNEIKNSIVFFEKFQDKNPKVALLAANEKVSDKVPSTKLAEKIVLKYKEKTDLVIEGPISFDLAVSKKSAQIKKYKGQIKGDADLFIAPRIETANVLYDSLQHILHVNMGGVILGATCPIVYTSNADSIGTIYNSLLLGIALLAPNR